MRKGETHGTLLLVLVQKAGRVSPSERNKRQEKASKRNAGGDCDGERWRNADGERK